MRGRARDAMDYLIACARVSGNGIEGGSIYFTRPRLAAPPCDTKDAYPWLYDYKSIVCMREGRFIIIKHQVARGCMYYYCNQVTINNDTKIIDKVLDKLAVRNLSP